MEVLEFNKLRRFLSPNRKFLTEQDTLYVLVYVRKFIERINSREQFGVLQFYADWALHTEKDSIKDIDEIKEKITDELLIRTEKSSSLNNFLLMKDLKEQMSAFLDLFNLSNFTSNEEKWENFRKNLIRIISGCPLKISERMNIEVIYTELRNKTFHVEITYS